MLFPFLKITGEYGYDSAHMTCTIKQNKSNVLYKVLVTFVLIVPPITKVAAYSHIFMLITGGIC